MDGRYLPSYNECQVILPEQAGLIPLKLVPLSNACMLTDGPPPSVNLRRQTIAHRAST